MCGAAVWTSTFSIYYVASPYDLKGWCGFNPPRDIKLYIRLFIRVNNIINISILLDFIYQEEEEIRDSRVYDVSIDAHSSPYAIVFKEGAKSLYLTTYLMLKNNAEETTYRIYVTYYSPTWSKVS